MHLTLNVLGFSWDFNNVSQTQDRIGGNHVTEVEFRDLVNVMGKTDLIEKHSVGDHYTWFNKHSNGPIYSRIDRVVGNMEWHTKNMNIVLKIMDPRVSDHALLCLEE